MASSSNKPISSFGSSARRSRSRGGLVTGATVPALAPV